MTYEIGSFILDLRWGGGYCESLCIWRWRGEVVRVVEAGQC